MVLSLVVDCGEPDTMNENIEIKFNQTTYLSSADYNCKPGYEIIGSSVRLCSFNGNWTGADPYCQLITTPSSSTTSTGNFIYHSMFNKEEPISEFKVLLILIAEIASIISRQAVIFDNKLLCMAFQFLIIYYSFENKYY